jgi:hypothetical protein
MKIFTSTITVYNTWLGHYAQTSMASDGPDGGHVGMRRRISIRKSWKPIPSEHIKKQKRTFRCYYNTKDTLKLVVQPNMNFAEIMHWVIWSLYPWRAEWKKKQSVELSLH